MHVRENEQSEAIIDKNEVKQRKKANRERYANKAKKKKKMFN